MAYVKQLAIGNTDYDIKASAFDGVLPIANGGTNASTTATAKENLNLCAVGQDFRLANYSTAKQIWGFRANCVNANNTNLNGKNIGFVVENDRILLYNQTDSESIWSIKPGDYVQKTGDTMTGNLLINVTTDIGLTDTTNAPLQIGARTGENLALDLNEIMARNNGATATLNLNHDGGNIYCGGTVLVGTTGDGIKISKSSSIADNLPAIIRFENTQTDNNITTNTSYIAVYDDHDTNNWGSNMVIHSAGGMIIGGGESSANFYANGVKGITSNSGVSAGANSICLNDSSEFTAITSDGSIFFLTNCNTIANRNTSYIDTNGYYRGTRVYGAVWNDYAEYRTYNDGDTPYGKIVCENGDDTVSLSKKRLQKASMICSNTFGFAIGEENNGIPIAVAGRALVYPLESKEEFAKHIGDPVCSGPDGKASLMTAEEAQKYPECIIGYVSAIPSYEEWSTEKIKVDGRVWIKIK